MATPTSSQKILQSVSIEDFIAGLRKLEEKDFTGVQGTLEYMRANPVDPETLQPYLFWNPQHYTRNLIDKTDLYELLSLCWEPGMKSSIHNHKGQNCWMAAPVGRFLVQNYCVLEENLAAHHCNIVPTEEVAITWDNPVAVDPLNPVHDVRNPRELNQRAVSLHIYSRPFDSCVVYSVEQCSCGEIGLQYTSMYGKLCGKASN
jgi:cysteine dioxygenase